MKKPTRISLIVAAVGIALAVVGGTGCDPKPIEMTPHPAASASSMKGRFQALRTAGQAGQEKAQPESGSAPAKKDDKTPETKPAGK